MKAALYNNVWLGRNLPSWCMVSNQIHQWMAIEHPGGPRDSMKDSNRFRILISYGRIMSELLSQIHLLAVGIIYHVFFKGKYLCPIAKWRAKVWNRRLWPWKWACRWAHWSYGITRGFTTSCHEESSNHYFGVLFCWTLIRIIYYLHQLSQEGQ